MNLEELENIAWAARQGKWWYEPSTGVFSIGCDEEKSFIPCVYEEENAQHIATFDPETVLKLLSKLKQYKEALKNINKQLTDRLEFDKGNCFWCGGFEYKHNMDCESVCIVELSKKSLEQE